MSLSAQLALLRGVGVRALSFPAIGLRNIPSSNILLPSLQICSIFVPRPSSEFPVFGSVEAVPPVANLRHRSNGQRHGANAGRAEPTVALDCRAGSVTPPWRGRRPRPTGKPSRPQTAPQRFENIESTPGNDRTTDAPNLQDLVSWLGRASRPNRRGASARKLQFLAPKSLKRPASDLFLAGCRTSPFGPSAPGQGRARRVAGRLRRCRARFRAIDAIGSELAPPRAPQPPRTWLRAGSAGLGRRG